MGAPLLRITPNSSVSKYVGDSSKLLTAYFEVAWKLRRAVIVVDECNAMFKAKKPTDAGGLHMSTSQFNTLLDRNFKVQREGRNRTIVICTANQHTSIDQAVFSRMEEVPMLPPQSAEERTCILKVRNC